ncbi:uracil phosphoribosyltransferase [Galbibacter mesophilus]|uniref:uracil phosphoribosyltransferase n=1 Tax=Galbibacter mesophilus TaxID=379069 RepID=UPI00191DA331|nr:uracil phosphoribosyltransferase [Galbibacter mesophilus]MCM5662310.1 uracil phosphoribosyltransferase [Galbibacter mesophilus]
MKIHNLSAENSIVNHFLAELRNEKTQKDRMRFRRNIERMGEVLAYEMSKTLHFSTEDVSTPLGKKETSLVDDELVVCSILRAGLPLHQGVLNYLDWADCSFISAYRYQNPENEFEVTVEYLASQKLDNKVLVLADPMLATGQSLLATFEALSRVGLPREIHILSVVGAQAGVEFLEKQLPKDTQLWIGDIDEELNQKGYIVPGLGDAGDLAFGERLQK